jgi:hypothetical protein
MLNVGEVFYCSNPGFSGSEPHNYIVIKKIPPESVAVVYITSKVEETKKRCRRAEGIKFEHIDPTTFVPIDKSICPRLKVPSAINCNHVEIDTISNYKKMYKYEHRGKLNSLDIIPQIIKASKSSDTLVKKIKDQL